MNISLLKLAICISIVTSIESANTRRPNIIILLADDLGIGDIGCFGNDTIRTPNIDRIADEGAKLTHNLAAAAVCTPSRSALLTGRYPVRTGMAPRGDTFGPRPILFAASEIGLPLNETTLAEVAKQAGYSTGIIGKWHLGFNCKWVGDNCKTPDKHGFDYFYGTPLTNMRDLGPNENSVVFSARPDFRRTYFAYMAGGFLFSYSLFYFGIIGKKLFFLVAFLSVFWPGFIYFQLMNLKLFNSILMRNNEIVEMPIRFENLTQRWVQEGTEFIDRQIRDDQPFFLFMSFFQTHTYLSTSKEFAGVSKYGEYGDNVEELDWAVGEIMKKLEKTGLKENTLVYFSSDHGGHVEEHGKHGERHGGHNGIYRGGKFQGGVDGGIRVPTTVMWPGKIPSGVVISEPTTHMDLFPTISNILNVPLPNDRIIDGHDVLPLLDQRQKVSSHEFLFHYCRTYIHAVRYRPRTGKDVWKIRYATPNWEEGTEGCGFVCDCHGPTVIWHQKPLLFNIEKDPRESNPLDTSDPKYKKIKDIMLKAVEEHKQSIVPVPSQYSFYRLSWKPWLQPCCNFPYCSCKDPKYAHLSEEI